MYKFKKNPHKLPKYMLTYLCNKCGFDFAITEEDQPKCFYCDSSNDYVLIEKKRLTPQVIAERLAKVNKRMEENLKQAWEITQEEDFKDRDHHEAMVLDCLQRVKKLGEDTQKALRKKK